MWALKIHIPGKKSWEYSLKPGKNTIGRDESMDIRLNRPSVSRQHAHLDHNQAENTVLLKDTKSTNGTMRSRIDK
ncbi:MAG: hypothetical protein MAG431_01012 [Chloroflexi bacterium]|nr:hypothetical protein [Chloroflexota bacterium]